MHFTPVYEHSTRGEQFATCNWTRVRRVLDPAVAKCTFCLSHVYLVHAANSLPRVLNTLGRVYFNTRGNLFFFKLKYNFFI